VGQIATLAMEQRRGAIEAALRTLLSPRAVVWKNDSGARDLEGLAQQVVCEDGDVPAQLDVFEQDLHFQAPLADGQKTGWFYDQTANRRLLRGFLPAGARVLDVCSYVGGWAVSALAAGAAEALCVAASATALEAAAAHAARTGLALPTRRGDA